MGEATGEPAVSTGEVYAFRLPRSKLRASVTTKTWLPAKYHPIGEGVRPHIAAPITARQIARGEDPGFEAIRADLEHPRGGSNRSAVRSKLLERRPS